MICQSSKYIQIQKKSSGWSAHQNSNDRSFSEMQSHGVTNFINKVDLLFYRRGSDPSLFGSIRVNSDSRGRSIVSFVFFPLLNLFSPGVGGRDYLMTNSHIKINWKELSFDEFPLLHENSFDHYIAVPVIQPTALYILSPILLSCQKQPSSLYFQTNIFSAEPPCIIHGPAPQCMQQSNYISQLNVKQQISNVFVFKCFWKIFFCPKKCKTGWNNWY